MGQPLVWYYENKDKIELFNQPGVHPQYGIILQPITSEIVRKVLSDLVKQEEKQLDAKTAELSATILVKSVETPIQEDGVINNQKPLLQQLGCYFPQDQSQKNGLLRNKANYDTYWLFFEEGISIRKCIVLAGKAKSISLPPGDYEYKIYKSLAGDNLIKHGVIDVSTISAEDKPWESWEVYNGENIDFSLKWNPFNNEDDNESINPIKPMERYPGRDNQP